MGSNDRDQRERRLYKGEKPAITMSPDSRRARTFWPIRIARGESPCTQTEPMGVLRCLPSAVIIAALLTMAKTRSAASSGSSMSAPF